MKNVDDLISRGIDNGCCKEIHGYLNKDGAYRVEIIGSAVNMSYRNGFLTRDSTKCSIQIPRASIAITVYEADPQSRELATILEELEFN